jgi:hypothetical protein
METEGPCGKCAKSLAVAVLPSEKCNKRHYILVIENIELIDIRIEILVNCILYNEISKYLNI